MWLWDISSRPSIRSPFRAHLAAVAAALLLLGGAGAAAAKVFLTVEEALALAFPEASVERRTAYLTEEQRARARALAGVEVPSALITHYVATRDGQVVGTAYFDSHRVRTLPETLMITVDPEGEVGRVEVVTFREPEDYIPREVWYRQFDDRPLDDELQLKRGIRGVTGATLTARATTDAVRRALALHRVLNEEAASP
jgi:hypothetical protein